MIGLANDFCILIATSNKDNLCELKFPPFRNSTLDDHAAAACHIPWMIINQEKSSDSKLTTLAIANRVGQDLGLNKLFIDQIWA